MRIQSRLMQLAEQLTGTRIFRQLPQGVDLFVDLKKLLPHFIPETIIDVGANVGQSARAFAKQWPHCQIFCFEPIGATFAKLQRNMRHLPGVRCFQLALGASAGAATMQTHELSVLNSLLDRPPTEAERKAGTTELVQIERLDEFCRQHGVERIDFLKVDTEGQDLKVLEGAAPLLDEARLAIVELEAGMNPTNELHVPFQQLVDFMQSRGYLLFGIYDQQNEWQTGDPQLRRSNPVFFSKSALNRWK